MSNLQVWDFLVNAVPGMTAILLLAGLPLVEIGSVSTKIPGSALALAVIVLAYITGRLLQKFSRWVDGLIRGSSRRKSKSVFKSEMVKAREDEKWSIRKRYLHGSRRYFDDGSSKNSANNFDDFDLYELTQSYLHRNNIDRSYTFQMQYVLMRNLYVVFLFGMVSYIFALAIQVSTTYSSVGMSFELVLLIGILAIGAYGGYRERILFQQEMVKSMYRDFYAAELAHSA